MPIFRLHIKQFKEKINEQSQYIAAQNLRGVVVSMQAPIDMGNDS